MRRARRLIIPERFGRDIARGVNSPVQSAGGCIRLQHGAADRGLRQRRSPARSMRQTAGAARAAPVQAAMRLLVQPRRRFSEVLGPGIFVLALSLFPPLLATLAMAKEGEQKTILQVYVSSISAHEFLLGKICHGSRSANGSW